MEFEQGSSLVPCAPKQKNIIRSSAKQTMCVVPYAGAHRYNPRSTPTPISEHRVRHRHYGGILDATGHSSCHDQQADQQVVAMDGPYLGGAFASRQPRPSPRGATSLADQQAVAMDHLWAERLRADNCDRARELVRLLGL